MSEKMSLYSAYFPAKNMPDGYHPGYDEAAGGRPLYDFVEDIGFSLYWWEIRFTGNYVYV